MGIIIGFVLFMVPVNQVIQSVIQWQPPGRSSAFRSNIKNNKSNCSVDAVTSDNDIVDFHFDSACNNSLVSKTFSWVIFVYRLFVDNMGMVTKSELIKSDWCPLWCRASFRMRLGLFNCCYMVSYQRSGWGYTIASFLLICSKLVLISEYSILSFSYHNVHMSNCHISRSL